MQDIHSQTENDNPAQIIEELQSQLEEANQTIASLERRQRIDSLLAEADAVDVETARLLTEVAVQSMDEPDVDLAVDDLRRDKPFLFHPQRSSAPGLALSPQVDEAGDPLIQAAEQAQHSGDRRDLLRYLRLRRRA